MFLKLTVIILLVECALNEEVNLAGLFENDEVHAKAFQYAIDSVNKAEENELTLVPVVNNLAADEPFSSLQYTCQLFNQGTVAILGPNSLSNIEAVQSLCDAKEIPHIITRWNYFPRKDSTEINFYPHPPTLSRAYFEIVEALQWKTFTVLYEDDEGLLRLLTLIHLAKEKRYSVTLLQLDKYRSETYRPTLKEARQSGQKHFVVDCSMEILKEVLLQIQQAGIMNKDYHYFITNLDAHTEDLTSFQFAEANITGIRIVNPENEIVQEMSKAMYADDSTIIPEMVPYTLRTETALIIDAVHMFSSVLSDIKKQSSSPIVSDHNILPCNGTGSWEHGLSIVNLLKTSSTEGLTGLIRFNTEGFRSDFDLSLYELREGGLMNIGTWNNSAGVSIVPQSLEQIIPDGESLVNKTFIVIITLTDPYGMLKETHETLTGNDRFEGYGIDLIQKLAEMEGFNYTFIVREDKKNGAKNETTGRWSGMIGDLLEYRADLAITDFTITSEREEAVDFTVPFMNLGISILFKKPFTAPPSFFSFADPFALDTWIALAVSFFVVALSLFVIGRLCPDEWTNPYPCIEEPEYLINQFSMNNSIWFVTGSLMCQGSEIAPIAISTRMVAGAWWFFCLLIVASYTANLAAFLATENPVELFKDIQTLYENAPIHKIKYGAKKDGATEKFFTKAEGGIFKKIGEHIKQHPEDAASENDLGVKKAEEELFAFFMESTSIEYTIQRHCELQRYGNLLDDKGYGIAMRKESSYRKRLSTAILKLQSSGVLDELKRRWWEERRGGGQCTGTTESSEATPLGLKNVEGCFWVTIYGTIIAGIFVIFEHLIYVLKISRRAKIPFMEAFMKECKFYFDFNSNSKAVIGNSSDTSKSDSEEVKSQSTKSESSPRSRTMSRSRSKSRTRTIMLAKSRTKSMKDNRNSTIERNGYPYGFIMSPSLERLDVTS